MLKFRGTRVFCWLLGCVVGALTGFGQQTVYVVDQFNSYPNGSITNVWGNWFGGAFQSLSWDSTQDASNNPNSGAMKIVSDFTSANNQFVVFDGYNAIAPPLNGLLYNNFQCDVKFAAGSALTTNSGKAIFGHLQFGVISSDYGQDYFGAIDVASTNTNWVHVSIPISAAADTNLLLITNVLIHIYGPYYGSLTGPSTMWVDNIEFTGPGPSVVDWSESYQRIDGFGASSAWRSTWTSAQADMFFSTNIGTGVSLDGTTNFSFNGIGLSLLRNHIVPANTTSASDLPTTAEISIMQMAQTRGARVWSTPWTPPGGFKSTNTLDGGNYLGSGQNATNAAYASQLANYVVNMKNQYGINLYALSVQNEPDAAVTNYEAAVWTGAQIHDFVTNLYAALAANGVSSTKILLPESQTWSSDKALFEPTLNDSAASADVAIIADHDYVTNNVTGDETTPAALTTGGMAVWETEVAQIGGAYDGSITNALYWAGRIHLYMTAAQANAWHYWWLIPSATDNEGLTDYNGIPAKRMYALGNFSRFVRPNFNRIGSTSPGAVQISAYQDSASSQFAIVAINSAPEAVPQQFVLTNGGAITSVTPWVTSSSLSLAPQTAVAVNNLTFTYTMPAMSIVTFVGQAQSSYNQIQPSIPLPNFAQINYLGNANALYYLQGTASLSSGVWTNVTELRADQNGRISYLTSSPSSAAVFYRIVSVP